jgi:hypothetical protein
MSKHRHERFQPGWVVMRIDEYPSLPDLPPEEKVYVKEVWLTQQDAEQEADRLNALAADKNCRYVVRYTRLARE